MPELPEVETVKETLKHQISGLFITKVVVYYDKMMSQAVAQALSGQQILTMNRLGKYIIFNLTNLDLISHLRMEGRYFIKTDEPVLKHEHVVFHLSNGQTLRYHDTRKFGTFDLKTKDQTYTTPPLSKLGKEPFDLNPEDFYNRLKQSKKPIKTALLDQTIVSGIGNIYADEILFASHVQPLRRADKVTKKEATWMIERGKGILESAIEAGGTTIRTYVSSLGVTGRFQLTLMVHQRKDEQCYICGDQIQKVVVGGRSSFYCKTCQKR
ncbi:MAG: DNA-formamidopyrimidine glycosylase [Tenericutes bacterium HGW-Tenericutes-8]|nr:MAG: DNA-formamidopyrimidine glycosylase [Tenericutes bacterium HGW-Tenericutes-8]